MCSMDFDDFPIEESEVIAILGNDYKMQGQELVWRCPACPGGDKSGDNMKFNRHKHVLHCFSCDFAEEITGIIARRRLATRGGNTPAPQQQYDFQRREPDAPEAPKETPKKSIEQDKLSEYYFECNNRLMSNKDLLKKMYQTHNIMPMTAAECIIGYDDVKKMLVFPSRICGKDPMDNMLVVDNGAEYRELEGAKTIRRITGYDKTGICMVRYSMSARCAIICEGYKDAYNLVQILKIESKEMLDDTIIFTLQNGTNSINTDNCLQKINWRAFNNVYLLMDDDKAGDHATEIAQELFPFMVDARGKQLHGHNDVHKRFETEYAPMVDIDKALTPKWLDGYCGSV